MVKSVAGCVLTMSGVRRLVLLVLLTGATSSEEYDDDVIIEDYTDPCDEEPRLPSIAAVTASKETFRRGDIYYVLYGESIALQCSSTTAASLKIQYKENDLQTTKLNTTSIESSIKKPDVKEYEYRCTDSITGCENSLNIIVEPVMSVSSPNVQLKLNEQRERVYFVAYKEEFQIYCSGNDFNALKIAVHMELFPLKLQTVNITTIKHETQANHIGVTQYYCVESESRGIKIVVDRYPQARNFQCVLYQWHKLECSWTSSSKKNSFKLFDIRIYDDYTTLICAFSSGEASRVCETYQFMGMHGDGVLQLQTCNEVFCDNQIFFLHLPSILKLDPPTRLKLLSTSSTGAVISWQNPEDVFSWVCDFKIEYRLLAKEWRQANATAVPCDENDCKFQLFLDCPDSHYEVRVYVKLKQAAEEKFWSEPASLYFFTAPSNTGNIVDQSCHAALQEPEPITSAETGRKEVEKLIRHTIRQKSTLKEKISVLQQKLAMVKALAESIAASETGGSPT